MGNVFAEIQEFVCSISRWTLTFEMKMDRVASPGFVREDDGSPVRHRIGRTGIHSL
jgi:hypothetical protein